MDTHLFVIIPVHNRKSFTQDCLHSLRDQTTQNFRIIIFDDGSTDGTSEMIAREFPDIEVLTGDGNLYWTASVNQGIMRALEQGTTHVLTLNNDTIATKDYIEQTLRSIEKSPQALFGALALDAISKEPVYGGEIINWKFNTCRNLLEELRAAKPFGLYEVSHFPGRGLLIPKVVFDKIGLFDERTFPHYAADYDFTHKAIRNGFKVYCNYDTKIYTYPKASGDWQNRQSKNLKNYMNHLFGIKGGGNLRNFTLYTFRNCPFPCIPFFLLSGYIRRIFGYIIK